MGQEIVAQGRKPIKVKGRKMRDRLFLLSPNFLDPAFPGQRFFCWHCALLEGVLASFPNLAESLDVERISWPRPRQSVIDLIGVENQSLPVLILADDAEAHLETDSANGRRFAEGKDAILRILELRYGIPIPHP